MPFKIPKLIFQLTAASFTLLISACGNSESSGPVDEIPLDETPITSIPENSIRQLVFRDTNPQLGQIGGTITIRFIEQNNSELTDEASRAEHIRFYWADDNGDTRGDAWQQSQINELSQVQISASVIVPPDTRMIKAFLVNRVGQATEGLAIRFDDFTGNSLLSGPGGNEAESWYYGESREKIVIRKQNETCYFDNGLVSVIDMANQKDSHWQNHNDDTQPYMADDNLFPPYQFECGDEPVNTFREISDEIGIWTYSTLNDAMYYGTLVYDTFIKYLGEPALDDKIRLRVHYGARWQDFVYWDGAYANFGDAYPFQYSMLSLDSVAHEVAHGVLTRISALNPHLNTLNKDAMTLHEAFGDISGVMAKYDKTGSADWLHGGENHGRVRKLDSIQTESQAIASYFDYDDAGENYYLRIGMITYPFYLLSQKWGLEATYQAYLNAAKTCWQADGSLQDAALCIKLQAAAVGGSEADVIDAFKAVKIQLFEQGVLSHFKLQQNNSQVSFSDNSQSTAEVVDWLWDFGNGVTSTEQNPTYQYSTEGDYKVHFTVTDSEGFQDSFSRNVQILK